MENKYLKAVANSSGLPSDNQTHYYFMKPIPIHTYGDEAIAGYYGTTNNIYTMDTPGYAMVEAQKAPYTMAQELAGRVNSEQYIFGSILKKVARIAGNVVLPGSGEIIKYATDKKDEKPSTSSSLLGFNLDDVRNVIRDYSIVLLGIAIGLVGVYVLVFSGSVAVAKQIGVDKIVKDETVGRVQRYTKGLTK